MACVVVMAPTGRSKQADLLEENDTLDVKHIRVCVRLLGSLNGSLLESLPLCPRISATSRTREPDTQ